MRTAPIPFVMALASIACGCAKHAATAQQQQSPQSTIVHPQATAAPTNASDIVVRIRKLGGADGKQVLNQLAAPTPIGEDFNVTEQVGATQFVLRGKVEDLKDGIYRVRYHYIETSATGVKELNSLVEMRPNTEKQIGGLAGGAGMETLVLSLSRS